MKVIAGQRRGQSLFSPQGTDIRPTKNSTKEAIFNIIQFKILDAHFLDLFAGSGQMGIEALSRGARDATFVDSSRESIDLVKKNLNKTQLVNKAKIFHISAENFILKNKSNTKPLFDIIFLDPPYDDSSKIQSILEASSQIIQESGIILYEHSRSTSPPVSLLRNFICTKIYNYGATAVAKYEMLSS